MAIKLSSWEEAVRWLRNQPDSTELVRACFFDDPQEAAALRYYESREWTAVRELVGSAGAGRKALDIGAGRGISSYALARDGWQVSALEPDTSELVGSGAIRVLARATKLNIEVIEDHGEVLPFGDATFDLIHCRQVLHHARDLSKLCMEAGRVLKIGGIFIASREHVISRQADLDVFLRNHPLHRYYGGENAFRLDEYKKAIEGGGIKLERVLNPFESDINLMPETIGDVKRRIAKKLRWPFPTTIPNRLVTTIGSLINTPGRLYTFFGRKTK